MLNVNDDTVGKAKDTFTERHNYRIMYPRLTALLDICHRIRDSMMEIQASRSRHLCKLKRAHGSRQFLDS